MKIFLSIIAILFGIAAIVGVGICAVNLIKAVFDQGGSYTAAMAGFIIAFVGDIVCHFAAEFIKED